jgi:hypothetical protein
MSDLSNLQTRRSAILAELAALDSTKAGGKPSYSADGQAVDHVKYKMSLYEELKQINELLASPALAGPWEIESVGI